MASNFRMLVAGKGRNLRIKLVGDFDGTSAHRVASTVKKHSKKAREIYIDTSKLRNIHPFGLDILRSNLSSLSNSNGVNLMFNGAHAAELAPK